MVCSMTDRLTDKVSCIMDPFRVKVSKKISSLSEIAVEKIKYVKYFRKLVFIFKERDGAMDCLLL